MIRTQIYLLEETHRELSLWAKKMDSLMGKIVRRIIKIALEKKEKILKKATTFCFSPN